MTGERTPDATPASKPGSSDNEISLREHLQRQLDQSTMMFNNRLEERHQFFDASVVALSEKLDERAANITARLAEFDLRYQQRFDAQQTALKDALSAAEKAVSAALTAADLAVAKAEGAAEKRFESVNEFRATLSDQAQQLMPRAEANARFNAMDAIIANLTKIIDRQEGKSSGLNAGWGYLVGAVGFLATVIGLVVWVVSATGKG